MSEEWIVEVDEQNQLVGKVERTVAHDPKQLKRHREVMVLLYKDRSHATFLLQHRSMKKKQFPGYWTLSATGHVDFADITPNDQEGYLLAASREAGEEIGVVAKELKLMGTLIQKLSDNWAVMGVVEGVFEGKIELDLNEVSEVRVFDRETVLGVSDKLTPGAKACLKYLGILK